MFKSEHSAAYSDNPEEVTSSMKYFPNVSNVTIPLNCLQLKILWRIDTS